MQPDSERLLYQKISRDEFSNYAKWYMNEDVMKYITGKALNLQETQLRFEKAIETNALFPELGLYAVKNKENLAFIGIAKLVYLNERQAEVGYGMLPQYWGKGYATEILQTLVKYASHLVQIKALIAVVDPDNQASKKVLAKHQFTLIKKSEVNNRMVEYHQYKMNGQNEH